MYHILLMPFDVTYELSHYIEITHVYTCFIFAGFIIIIIIILDKLSKLTLLSVSAQRLNYLGKSD